MSEKIRIDRLIIRHYERYTQENVVTVANANLWTWDGDITIDEDAVVPSTPYALSVSAVEIPAVTAVEQQMEEGVNILENPAPSV